MTATSSYGRSKRRRKKKIGTIAIPFLITILISALVVGGIARYFYQKMTAINLELEELPAATASITEDDINTILFVLEPDDALRNTAMALLHFDPVRKFAYCIGVPINMKVTENDKQMTAEQCFENYGGSALAAALSKELDQEIPRYISMHSVGFQTLAGFFGNATVQISISDYGLEPKDVSQNIDNQQLETLLTSNKFYNESERNTVIGIAMASLINNGNPKRLVDNLESYFDQIVNCQDISTDITTSDFTSHTYAIKFLFQNAISPARYFGLVGTENEQGMFVLQDGFTDAMKMAFSQRIVGSEMVNEDGEIVPADGFGQELSEGTNVPTEQPAETFETPVE